MIKQVKRCDNTSVGILVWSHGSLLLIERARPPFGFAPPAGHVDDHGSFENAAAVELKEEVGLTATHISLKIEGRLDNRCRRPGGSWHHWKIYEATTTGNPAPSPDEARKIIYLEVESLQKYCERTLAGDTDRIIEPAWVYWFSKLKIVKLSNVSNLRL